MCDTTLIVPPRVETEITGFRLAAERTIHRIVWRVEFWWDNPLPRIFRNGVRVCDLTKLPEYAINFANRVNINILSKI